VLKFGVLSIQNVSFFKSTFFRGTRCRERDRPKKQKVLVGPTEQEETPEIQHGFEIRRLKSNQS
jgi:hypothetical protein